MHNASNWDTQVEVPTAQHLIRSSENKSASQWVDSQVKSCLITNGMQSGQTIPQDSAFLFPTPVPTPRNQWPSQEEPGSGFTASAPVSDVSTPACTNGVWPPLQPVWRRRTNRRPCMLSSNVQFIDLPVDCMAWRFWTMSHDSWDNRIAAQHLSRDPARPSKHFRSSGLHNFTTT